MAQNSGLRTKVLVGAQLTTLNFVLRTGLRLISTVVLTRLLAPEIYGVFAVVLMYHYILEMFSDLGIRSVILTKEDEVDDDFLCTCWTISILRGCIVACVSCIIALAIYGLQSIEAFAADSPYTAPVLPWALAALGATIIINGMLSPIIYVREREMVFGKVTLVEIVTNVLGLIVTIALAYYLRSVWALVLGDTVRAVIRVVLSFVMFPGPKMRLTLDRAASGIVLNRGKWIVGHSVLSALMGAGDRMVLGLVMSSSTFGYYFIARQLVDMVQTFLGAIDTQLGLQVFTHLHKSTTEKFRQNYYRYRLFFDAVAGLSTGALVVLSPLIIGILFDDRYQEVADITQILVWAILLTGPMLLRSAFSAERRFKEMTMLGLVSAVTLWGGLGFAVFILESQTVALMVIALLRLPEAMLLIILGGDRDWVIIWREFLGFFFCIIGILLGQGVLWAWALLI